ncbi:DUF6894 family protein [Mesorhizobium sp. 10J20-29]
MQQSAPMVRYYFDIKDGDDLSVDDTGIECSGPEEARFQAIDALPEIARDELPDGDNRFFEVNVRDDQGRAVFRCRLTLETEWL